MFKKAFTMMELVIALALVAILALVTISIAKGKLDKIDKFSYYLGYSTVQNIAANIVAQTKYDYDWSDEAGISVLVLDSAINLCNKIKSDYNISKSNCNISANQMSLNTQNGFKNGDTIVEPHIKLSNGLNIYITTDMKQINDLSDAVDVRDRVGYLVYADVNGDKGKGIKYQDVYPFYLLVTGKVIPLYNSSGVGGANNVENLAGNILYDDYSTGNRVVKALETNVDFRKGACETGFIRSSRYCGGIAINAFCTSNPNSDCRYVINKPMKFFGR